MVAALKMGPVSEVTRGAVLCGIGKGGVCSSAVVRGMVSSGAEVDCVALASAPSALEAQERKKEQAILIPAGATVVVTAAVGVTQVVSCPLVWSCMHPARTNAETP